jgi:NTE family protein
MSASPKELGLSLSGGGYRAAAFHLGTLRKLQEMNILERVNVLSTISGGSITGAYYCLNKDDYIRFDQDLYEALQSKNVINKLLFSSTFFGLILFVLVFLGSAFYFLFATVYPWMFVVMLVIFLILLLKFQFHIFPISKRVEKIYDQFFYKKATLENLPVQPTLVIGSTNLQTSRPFTFSRTWMQDSTYQYRRPPIKFKAAKFPIARAVMASSCVPPAFRPIKIFLSMKPTRLLYIPYLLMGECMTTRAYIR